MVLMEGVTHSSNGICKLWWGSVFNSCEAYLELMRDGSSFEIHFENLRVRGKSPTALRKWRQEDYKFIS